MFEKFLPFFYNQNTSIKFRFVIIPDMVPGLCLLIYFKNDKFVVFSFLGHVNALKFMHNSFDHNTQVKVFTVISCTGTGTGISLLN